ncbi:hypothetical protein JHD50_12475 [Sulfurimonas sp. MAG313]|nr:hypothetical protein [Sulfurimonas sp. MAG313]MDF1882104.1 hypothetical protein [Sulfurimonas sp. MAG313]
MTVAFFTEAGTKRGYGHLVRSYTIYSYFKKMDCICTFFLDSDIDFKEQYPDIQAFSWASLNLEKKYDIIFIDSYEADINIYKKIAASSKHAVYIDDNRRLEYPKGTILNFSPDADTLLYKDKDILHNYLLGLDFIPIREIFKQTKVKKEEQIFVMLGGSDLNNLSMKILESLENIKWKKVIVINNKEIAISLEKLPNVKVLYHPNDKELSTEMAKSSIAISTASMGSYELSYFSIPTIIISVAKNQEAGIKHMIKHKIAAYPLSINNKNWTNDIKEQIRKIQDKKHKITNQIDSQGSQRIFDYMKECI